jgi:N-acetylneuraminate synthase/N,N'-diacetyllegionaminate synthase
MVRAAAASGADAVKVQCFKADSFCTEAATYQGERQIDMFRRYELGAVGFSAIAEECRKLDLLFFGTPDSVEQARLLVALGAPCLKVGSDDIVHIPLLRQLSELGLPMILSTGMTDMKEINTARAAVRVPLILLHCVSEYPTPALHANLERMTMLMDRFHLEDVEVGYSDHTDGIDAAIGAVWLGACMVEKHFTLNRDAAGPDHAFSADPPQFTEMACRVRLAEALRGDGSLEPSEAEIAMRVTARRSIVAARSLDAGTKITGDMLAYKRPGDGIPPRMADEIVGRCLARAVAANEQMREGDWT